MFATLLSFHKLSLIHNYLVSFIFTHKSTGWCSLFNAELALSVTMTGISTLLSVFMSLVVVIGGIAAGVISSAWYNSTRFNLLANKLGNIAGISLVIFSVVVSSSSSEANLWSQEWKFYVGVAAPALIGVSIATYLATKFALEKPERVAVAVEGCYQNTGIATSVAASMFSGSELAMAISVPLLYGIFEAAILAIYCLVCWKIGWTKAPANENFCTMIVTSYEVEQARLQSPNAIEVVHNNNPKGEGDIEDLVFSQTVEGYQVDEVSLHEKTNASLQATSSTEKMDATQELSIEEEDDDGVKVQAGEFT
jgi:hypothetical protein